MESDNSGCHYYRSRMMGKALSKHFNVRFANCFDACESGDIIWSDIVVLQRSFADFTGFFKFAKGRCKIVYEIDDYVHNIPQENPASVFFDKDPKTLFNITSSLVNSDAVIFSTKEIQKRYKQYNDSSFILRNMVDFDEIDKVPFKVKKSKKLRILWAGSPTHYKDLKMVKDALVKIKQEFDVEIVLFGFQRLKSNYKYKYDWADLFKDVDVELKDFVRIRNYNLRLATFDADIAIAPLVDDEFNKYKSDIKFLEYASHKIPVIASNVKPYRTIKNGKTGFLVNNSKQFYQKLKLLIENPELRKRIVKNAYKYAKSRSLQKQANNIIKIYKLILKK